LIITKKIWKILHLWHHNLRPLAIPVPYPKYARPWGSDGCLLCRGFPSNLFSKRRTWFCRRL